MRRALLVSNSTNHGEGYLDHCLAAIDEFLGPVRRLLFVPFALQNRAAYGEKARRRLAAIGAEVDVLTADAAGASALEGAAAVFVGGGNTFRLLRALQGAALLEPLRRRALAGLPYLGASAGSNLAGPTIKTTNDMPIVELQSFAALGLVPFQINPHYFDVDRSAAYMGETREERLREFHEENSTPVVALREGAWARVEGDSARLGGRRGARVFRRGQPPEERDPGSSLDDLLDEA
jgi:dipeptidase E